MTQNGSQAIEALTALGDIKVWSLIVTVLGDRALDGRYIPSAQIAAALEPIGVKPDALRVSLHRLRRDDWVVSRRVGRTSEYALSAKGISISRRAAHRIYAAAPARDDWVMIVTDTAEEQATFSARPGVARLSSDVFLVPNLPPCGATLTAKATWPLPGWAIARIVEPDVWQGYERLAIVAQMIRRTAMQVEPHMLAAIRILVLHQWRRLVLRHPDVPDAAIGADWPGAVCRAEVQHLLSLIPRADAG
jgi:phenylacetic acid degradation operon negative regulatory protein